MEVDLTKRKRREFTLEFKADAITLVQASGIRRRLSRRGDCWDNAVAESVFRPLKSDLPLMPLI